MPNPRLIFSNPNQPQPERMLSDRDRSTIRGLLEDKRVVPFYEAWRIERQHLGLATKKTTDALWKILIEVSGIDSNTPS